MLAIQKAKNKGKTQIIARGGVGKQVNFLYCFLFFPLLHMLYLTFQTKAQNSNYIYIKLFFACSGTRAWMFLQIEWTETCNAPEVPKSARIYSTAWPLALAVSMGRVSVRNKSENGFWFHTPKLRGNWERNDFNILSYILTPYSILTGNNM